MRHRNFKKNKGRNVIFMFRKKEKIEENSVKDV